MATLADYGPEVRAEVKQVREVVSNLHQQLIKWNLVVWTDVYKRQPWCPAIAW